MKLLSSICLSSIFLEGAASFLQHSEETSIMSFDGEFNANSKAGRNLIESATLVEGSRSLEDSAYDFVGKYSIKFLDCHSVNQWNGDYDEDYEEGENEEEEGEENKENNGKRIIASSLIRFRLCPTSSCQHKSSSGCNSKYGDYVVDLQTFVYNYLAAQSSMNDEIDDYCYSLCLYEDDYCKEDCFKSNGGYGSTNDNDDDRSSNLDPLNYAQCAAYKDYYLGPYCSSDGKSVLLGLFSDDSCSDFAGCNNSCFKSKYGYNLPYSDESIIPKNCASCSYKYFSSSNDDDYYAANDYCQEIYSNSGKCETRMSIAYPNESACTYIEGIKHLQKNGVISSNAVKRSKVASMGIGMLTFMSIALGLYVHYLSTSKLGTYYESCIFAFKKLKLNEILHILSSNIENPQNCTVQSLIFRKQGGQYYNLNECTK